MQRPIGTVMVLLMATGAAFATAPDAPPVEAITRPSADVTLAFVRPGRIAEFLVKEGESVKPGDVLVRLDDEAERIQLAQLKASAEDLIRIKAAEAQVAQKKEDLKKLEWAGREGAATQWEVEHARLEVVIGELSVELAKFNQQQERGKYDEAKVHLARMQLTSPIAGKVEQTFLEAGESVEALAKVIRIVKTDVLWADVPTPLTTARRLAVGQKAQVEFPESDAPVEAAITHIAAVADAASETILVRVEIPNPAGRPAGERVRVRFQPTAPTLSKPQ